MTELRAGQRFREMLAKPEIVIAPGAYDAWSARLIERSGFPAVYMTGFGAAASVLGVPDLGLITATEMADHAARMASAVSLPVIADADTGFGDMLNVRRTIHLYESANVGAIQLEDQVSPKKCGHMENKVVVEMDEMVRRLKTAVSSRQNKDTVIIARTDARDTFGLDEALRRSEAYLEAGADMLFIEAPQSDEELQRICRTFEGVPLLANVVEAGKTPYHSAKELQDMGFSLAIFPISTLLAATKAVNDALTELSKHGRLVGDTPIINFKQFNQLMGLQDYIHDAQVLSED